MAEAIGAAKLLDRIGPSEKPSYQQLKGLTLPIEVNSRVRDCNRREEEARGTEGQERSAFRYLKHPMDTRLAKLALEIKIIDDQLAEDTKQTKRKTSSRN